jgi:hypothetical protein
MARCKFAQGDMVIRTGPTGSEEVTVLRVGRTRVWIQNGYREQAFDFEGREVGNYSHYKIHTKQDWDDLQRRGKLTDRLRAHGVTIDWHRRFGMSTDTLDRILAVLDEAKGG